MPRIEYGNGNWIEYKIGDALELIKEIPDKSIDLVLTDPPYGVSNEKDDVIDLRVITAIY